MEDELHESQMDFCNETVESCGSRRQVILHFDIDCFYAQVEMLKNPDLRKQPLGVQQKNIVVTCNYVAREKGVIKCSYIREALKVCPELILVNGEDLSDYRKWSQQIFEQLRRSSGNCKVEKLGMDENFVDISDQVQERMDEEPDSDQQEGYIFGNPRKSCLGALNVCECHKRLKIASVIANQMRKALFDKLGITSSCGIAHNKLLAKLGGAKNKPNKQTTIFHETVCDLMGSLSGLRSIPGLGSATCQQLQEKGIKSIRDLQHSKVSILSEFVQDAQRLIELANGVDKSVVKASGKPLSIGLEDRFKCISNQSECREKAKWLLSRLAKLVLEDGRKPSTLKVFIRDYEKDKHDPKRKFAKYSRQCKVTPSSFKDEESIVNQVDTVVQLIGKMVDFDQVFHLTLMGLSVCDFMGNTQGNITAFLSSKRSLEDQEPQEGKKPKVESIIHQASPAKIPHEVPSDPKISATKDIPYEWDQDVFNDLPDDIRNELLAQNHTPKPQPPKPVIAKHLVTPSNMEKVAVPSGWDKEVFQSLPDDIKNELIAGRKSQPQQPQTQKNSILKYFQKKQR